MSRVEAFGADDETHEVLGRLGYSHDEIHAVTGNLPSDMASEDKVRIGLRALSAEKSRTVQESAEAKVEQTSPKNPGNARTQPDNPDYWQGRRDEALARRGNQNQAPKPKARTTRQARPQHPAQNALKQAKQLQRMARLLGGKKR